MSAIRVAANRGDLAGGEVMLIRLARALVDLGHDVGVVAPAYPGEVATAAGAEGLPVTALDAADRRGYARALRRWHRGRRELLWCNGLLPAVATAGRGRRVVHLHQLPSGRVQQWLARWARQRATAVVVPSRHLAERVGGGAWVLPNWTDGPGPRPARPLDRDSLVVGFLGRVGTDKGVDVLADACARLEPGLRARTRLLIAGDDRFVDPRERPVVDAALARAGVPVGRPGWVSRDDFHAEVDVAVVPSRWAEPFGLVAAEAMGAGVPLVVSDAGALPEVVGPDHPWVAPRGDAAALAVTLTSALESLPASAVVKAQRQRWEAHYSPSAGRRNLAALLPRLGVSDAVPAPPPRTES